MRWQGTLNLQVPAGPSELKTLAAVLPEIYCKNLKWTFRWFWRNQLFSTPLMTNPFLDMQSVFGFVCGPTLKPNESERSSLLGLSWHNWIWWNRNGSITQLIRVAKGTSFHRRRRSWVWHPVLTLDLSWLQEQLPDLAYKTCDPSPLNIEQCNNVWSWYSSKLSEDVKTCMVYIVLDTNNGDYYYIYI
jgi:hypothetical protein